MSQDTVTLTIDGKSVTVPKGTNLVEAARTAGIEIPYYCYHPHLSVAGNCRMCQIEVKGQRNLNIGCNTVVQEGMEVLTQKCSQKVKDAQAATLEFILINHPLDCTVCDQAGHCKLQDYHFEYNARSSRFVEEKEHKVKALPLGPTVMLDGERCIMCTRCIRFCDEITGTSELGMANRGDKSVIVVNKERPLNNPLSGTVVDLCPVGALTHREWRFKSRIWFTEQIDSICPGCSTGCNVKVAVRDGEVVQVKARLNSEVNKEWLCDEGRYGFARFLPKNRVAQAAVRGELVSAAQAIKEASQLGQGKCLVLYAGTLLLEELHILKAFVERHLKNSSVALGYRERTLNAVEKILVSPDYCANYRGAQFIGLASEQAQDAYQAAISELKSGGFSELLLIGDWAIAKEDQTPEVLAAIAKLKISVGMLTDGDSQLAKAMRVLLPGQSVLEKSGLMLNRTGRLQYMQGLFQGPVGTIADWKTLSAISESKGAKLTQAQNDRELSLQYLQFEKRLAGITIGQVKNGLGVALNGVGS